MRLGLTACAGVGFFCLALGSDHNSFMAALGTGILMAGVIYTLTCIASVIWKDVSK